MSPADFLALVRRLGGAMSSPDRANVPGPGHGRADRSLSLRLIPPGRVFWYSFAGDSDADCREHIGLSSADVRRATPAEARAEREAREREIAASNARKLAHCQRLWGEVDPAGGTIVETYLRSRGLTQALPDALAYHPFAQVSADARWAAPPWSPGSPTRRRARSRGST